MTLKRALILAFVLIFPALGLAGATALGWLCFEWSPRGVSTVFGVYIGWATFLAALDQLGIIPIRKMWQEAAPAPRPGGPYQAPRPLADFVGREDQIRQLTHALKPGARAAITGVVGMGGIGKTELAKVVAHRVARRYRDGVLWADCGQERLADVADRWAGAYGVERLPGDDFLAKATSWRGLISGREALLIFDNVQPGQEVESLFPPPGSRSTVLITTRHADHPALRGIEPLPLDQFTPAEAMDLAERVLGREAARAQREDAEHLFELVGYLPLAVSIALHTAHERGWALAELNQALEEAGAIVALDEPGLRKSLRATFQTAWDNLPEELQRAFAALAVFNQGPSFHTIAMANVLEAEERDARALLNRLAGRSLLMPVGDGRWSLHPLLREFAAGKLPAEDIAWGRMAAHYAQVARAANALYLRGGEDLLRGLRLFDQEWPHIRAGQAWAVQRAETDEKATRLCSDYPDAAYCLDLRQHPRERIAWLEAAAEAARRLGDRAAEGRHLGNLGIAYHRLGEYRKAIGYYEQALEIDREIGDRRGEGAALGNLGLAYADLGEVRKAIGYYEQALGIAREIGDRRAEGAWLGNLGLAYADLGDVREAIGYYERALKIDREIGDRRGEGADLGNLGLAYADLGEVRKAIGYYEQALGIAREIGDRRAEGAWLGNLGLAYADLGEVRKAIGYYEQALEIRREIGDRRGEGNDLANMGQAYKRLGDVTRARELWEEALRIYEAIEDPRAEWVRGWLGELGEG